MMGEFRRCEVHGTVLTPAGACVLCARRTTPPASSGRGMRWLLFGVTGAALAAIVGYRIHLALADRAAAVARPDSLVVPAVAAATTEGSSPAATEAAPTATPPPNEVRPSASELRVEHERLVGEAARAVEIDLYGEGWCPSCKKARAWLDANAIAYTYRDTSNAVNQHTMRALNPKSTIPTINIEGQVVVGFRPEAIQSSIRRAAEARVAKNGR